MGQKTPPRLNRLGIVSSQSPSGRWYASRSDFACTLLQDLKLRGYFDRFPRSVGIQEIRIERTNENINLVVVCVRPGVMIGKKGADIDSMKRALTDLLGAKTHVSIKELKKHDLYAKLVAENVAQQLERRVMFRKAMKRALQNTMRAGAIGIKVQVSGRLGGAEIARSEMYRAGRVPLHTFKADIDFHIATAFTTYGIIGVKVWIYRSDQLHSSTEKVSRRRISDQ
jgi:small subunit ribosomal protein S3